MRLLFVVGVEGSGHSMLKSLMQYVVAQPHFLNKGEWREMMVRYWNPRYRYKSEFSFLRRNNRDKIKRRWRKLVEQYSKDGVTHLVEDVSFPYNQPRSAIRRPDIIDFVDLLNGEVDVRVLVLYRNPVSATYSSLRRGFTKNVYEQARIVEDNLIYIDRHLSLLGSDRFRVLPFERFLATPLQYMQGLADWMETEVEFLQKGMVNLQSPHSLDDVPDRTRRILEDFFTPDRIKLWSALASDTRTIAKNKNSL